MVKVCYSNEFHFGRLHHQLGVRRQEDQLCFKIRVSRDDALCQCDHVLDAYFDLHGMLGVIDNLHLDLTVLQLDS